MGAKLCGKNYGFIASFHDVSDIIVHGRPVLPHFLAFYRAEPFLTTDGHEWTRMLKKDIEQEGTEKTQGQTTEIWRHGDKAKQSRILVRGMIGRGMGERSLEPASEMEWWSFGVLGQAKAVLGSGAHGGGPTLGLPMWEEAVAEQGFCRVVTASCRIKSGFLAHLAACYRIVPHPVFFADQTQPNFGQGNDRQRNEGEFLICDS